MGLLDQAKQAAGGLGGLNSEQMKVAKEFIEWVHNQPGGFSGLLQDFRDKGFGSVVQSWIGNSKNLPITGNQIMTVLGKDRVEQLAQKFGMTADQAKDKLAQYLPEIVDKLSPNGEIPENSGSLGSAATPGSESGSGSGQAA